MTDKIQQARRAAFEVALAQKNSQRQGSGFDALRPEEVRNMWWAFNAALDCVVIDLPTPAKAMAVVIDYQDNKRQNVTGTTNWAANLGMCVVNECCAAIESTNLGIKVK